MFAHRTTTHEQGKACGTNFRGGPLGVVVEHKIGANGDNKGRIIFALSLFALCLLAALSSRRSDAERQVQQLATKIVELKREARRARSLESDEHRLEGELSEQIEENRRLRAVEKEERIELVSMQEKVELLTKEEKAKENEVDDLLDMVWEQLREAQKDQASRQLREGDAPLKAVGVLGGHLKELSEKVQLRSREQVLQRYGPGPHRVKLEIDIPENDVNLFNPDTHMESTNLGEFVIEMAPLDLMPHSIQFFMDQVEKGLWNGSSFYRNAFHVLQASPTASGGNYTQRFEEAGLMNTKFQEYSHQFPHVEYTVGFAGVNAGSVLMMNKIDNTKDHGPGGQEKIFGVDDGEPCFGKIISGFDTIKWLSETPTSNQKGPDYMDNYVKIRSASML